MNKNLFKLLFMTLAAALLTAGTAWSAESEEAFEDQGYYQGIYDNNYGNDWFYDSYGYDDTQIGEDESWGYFGEEDSNWFTDDQYYSGFYDDDNANNDWWFDTYDDPGDEGFWDI